jgi:hypothetical protein
VVLITLSSVIASLSRANRRAVLGINVYRFWRAGYLFSLGISGIAVLQDVPTDFQKDVVLRINVQRDWIGVRN